MRERTRLASHRRGYAHVVGLAIVVIVIVSVAFVILDFQSLFGEPIRCLSVADTEPQNGTCTEPPPFTPFVNNSTGPPGGILLTVNGIWTSVDVPTGQALVIVMSNGTTGDSTQLYTVYPNGVLYTVVSNAHFQNGNWTVGSQGGGDVVQKSPSCAFNYWYIGYDQKAKKWSNYVQVIDGPTVAGTICLNFDSIPLYPTIGNETQHTVTVSDVPAGSQVSVYYHVVYPYNGNTIVIASGTASSSGTFTYTSYWTYPWPLPPGTTAHTYATEQIWAQVGSQDSSKVSVYVHI